MKSNNTFYTIFIVLSMCFFFSCGRNHSNTKAAPVDEEMDSLEKAMAERVARMMEMESWPWIAAKDFPIDSLDIRIEDLSTPMLKRAYLNSDYSPFVLSEEDFNSARKLVRDYFQYITVDEETHSGKPYPYNHYFKQYIGYYDPDTGKDMIEVNLFIDEQTPHGWAGELKNKWLVVRDGGKAYGHILIDMKQKRVVTLSLNGPI